MLVRVATFNVSVCARCRKILVGVVVSWTRYRVPGNPPKRGMGDTTFGNARRSEFAAAELLES
jgi:hypothetical protein